MSTEQLVFPDELRSHTKTPSIVFMAVDGRTNENVNIALPCPPSISFNDAAEFSTIDLGVIGGVVGEAIKSGNLSGVKSIKASQVLDIIASKTPVAQLASFAKKTIINPNTNATFTGNRLRTFGFNFKLIAGSQKESIEIRNIHTAFRRFTYAQRVMSPNGATLSFPPKWHIKFVDFDSPTNENQYIPKIHECYLTQVESTFNSDANVFYSDSAPLQVDITLQFQETRVLTRHDIEKMRMEQVGNFGLDDKGKPFFDFPNPIKKVKAAVIEGVKNIF